MKGDYSPLNLNALGALLQNEGLQVPTKIFDTVGRYDNVNDITTHGSLVNSSVLLKLSDSIQLAYKKIGTDSLTQIPQDVYNNLTNIGHNTIPLLGNTAPLKYTRDYTGSVTRHGFLGMFAYQVYKEYFINNGSYTDFLSTLSTCISFKEKSNKVIRSLHKSQFFLDGIYSNMDDLITADVAGVSKSTFFWGTDLVNLGRALELQYIDKFGLPSLLLQTLRKFNGMTKAVNLALLSAGFNPTDINNISNGEEATIDQEKMILAAFYLIMDNDLNDVLIPLNCQTENLDSLADLLNVKKLFPYSYNTLTVPQYNSIKLPTNSKTYYLIYNNGEANVASNLGFGSRLANIHPEHQAYACDAFSMSMMQIKGIKNANIEKFSQAVTHLEIAQDLNVNGTSIPTDIASINPAFKDIAKGSGELHMYCTSDFFGCITDFVYPWEELSNVLQFYSRTGNIYSLSIAYDNIYNLVSGPGPYDNLQNLIDNANNALHNLKIDNPQLANMANDLYDFFGLTLTIEQDARDACLGDTSTLQTAGTSEVYSFMDVLHSYSLDTGEYQSAQVIENLCDLNTVGGRSIIGSMREYRNAVRLGLTGIELDNGVDYDELPTVKPTGTKPNEGTIYPPYTSAGQLKDLTIVTGATNTPGSLGGSPETKLIPSNLNLFDMVTAASVLPPEEAIHHVTICNCDCWDLLN